MRDLAGGARGLDNLLYRWGGTGGAVPGAVLGMVQRQDAERERERL